MERVESGSNLEDCVKICERRELRAVPVQRDIGQIHERRELRVAPIQKDIG